MTYLQYHTTLLQTKLEQNLMPAIHSLVLQHISKTDEDAKITQLCTSLSHVTQEQFGIQPSYQDPSMAPYYSAIAKFKSISTTLTPTRKIYNIVQAAKLVFEKLNELLERENHHPPGAGQVTISWSELIDVKWIVHVMQAVAFSFFLAFKEGWVDSDSVCNHTSDYEIAGVQFVNHKYDYRPTSDDMKSTYQLIIKITIFEKHKKWKYF